MHFDRASREGIELAQGGLAVNAQTPGRERCVHRLDASQLQLVLYIGALVGEGVHAQVQRRATIQALDQGPKALAHLGFEWLDQPLGHVVAVALHQIGRVHRFTGFEPSGFLLVQSAHQKVERVVARVLGALGRSLGRRLLFQVLGKTENGQATLFRARARGRKVVVAQFVAQHVVDGFGQGRTLARAKGIGFTVVTEKLRHHRVGRVVKLQSEANKLGTSFNKGFRVHKVYCPTL